MMHWNIWNAPIPASTSGENPTEIICEIEPASEHAEYSVAIASILRSKPHYHNAATEKYHVLKGELLLHVKDKTIKMKAGETYIVRPHEIHWAEGDFALVEVTSTPGWMPDDHILA